ncbi:MAG: deoxyribonuclease IV [Candidatus Magasanikbacteria bacterium]|nr:deoxyribonuclease IV [Candidatus Magasanikbacteria bacterium]
MFFGAHVSFAGGIFNAPLNAAHLGCEVFQMFSRSPQGGSVPPITPEIIKLFRQNIELCSQREWYIHTPYFINFASANNRIYYGSISVIRQELERGSLIGARYVMAHLGSYKDLGQKEGDKKVVAGLAEALKGYKGTTELLIEISAGAGAVIGDMFEEVAEILDAPKLKKYPMGVCFDTAHAFASGYDLRTPEAVAATFKKFDQTIGLKRLKMFHCNDSKADLNEHKDRHEHIGRGHIGEDGFRALLAHKAVQNLSFICETEHDFVREDLALLKKIRMSF